MQWGQWQWDWSPSYVLLLGLWNMSTWLFMYPQSRKMNYDLHATVQPLQPLMFSTRFHLSTFEQQVSHSVACAPAFPTPPRSPWMSTFIRQQRSAGTHIFIIYLYIFHLEWTWMICRWSVYFDWLGELGGIHNVNTWLKNVSMTYLVPSCIDAAPWPPLEKSKLHNGKYIPAVCWMVSWTRWSLDISKCDQHVCLMQLYDYRYNWY